MTYISRGLREFRVVVGSIWLNLVLFAMLLVGAAGLMLACGCYPGQTFGEVLVNAFYMTRIESVPESNHHLRAILVFVMPALTIIILGEGVLRVASIYLARRHHPEEWEKLMAGRLKGHTVLCGAGELGRALIGEMLRRDPGRDIVIVDTHPDVLQELGIQANNVRSIFGDMTSQQTLSSANVAAASTVIITSGDDAHNLEALSKAHGLNPKAQIWIRLYRSALKDMMDTITQPNIHFFLPYERAAQDLADSLDATS